MAFKAIGEFLLLWFKIIQSYSAFYTAARKRSLAQANLDAAYLVLQDAVTFLERTLEISHIEDMDSSVRASNYDLVLADIHAKGFCTKPMDSIGSGWLSSIPGPQCAVPTGRENLLGLFMELDALHSLVMLAQAYLFLCSEVVQDNLLLQSARDAPPHIRGKAAVQHCQFAFLQTWW
eukprot:CAMPEP_0197641176 /NCGR_PEP_ID=MMETSP1338-20131121/15218_1 /TAXON_ID=43686 ORGANISM="Pelagodinium beii, Strain RCC1491" /NCGR_SAMPLE_ID=MMETSP1338 /ASSEMBLY_ACC=CAM_ASM_000754 /LENGTH=176 /DNA_ID=CAMNT_0043214113 /DNA_START=415 /DNA_END=942 /DNA_ORIENTATION=-